MKNKDYHSYSKNSKRKKHLINNSKIQNSERNEQTSFENKIESFIQNYNDLIPNKQNMLLTIEDYFKYNNLPIINNCQCICHEIETKMVNDIIENSTNNCKCPCHLCKELIITYSDLPQVFDTNKNKNKINKRLNRSADNIDDINLIIKFGKLNQKYNQQLDIYPLEEKKVNIHSKNLENKKSIPSMGESNFQNHKYIHKNNSKDNRNKDTNYNIRSNNDYTLLEKTKKILHVSSNNKGNASKNKYSLNLYNYYTNNQSNNILEKNQNKENLNNINNNKKAQSMIENSDLNKNNNGKERKDNDNKKNKIDINYKLEKLTQSENNANKKCNLNIIKSDVFSLNSVNNSKIINANNSNELSKSFSNRYLLYISHESIFLNNNHKKLIPEKKKSKIIERDIDLPLNNSDKDRNEKNEVNINECILNNKEIDDNKNNKANNNKDEFKNKNECNFEIINYNKDQIGINYFHTIEIELSNNQNNIINISYDNKKEDNHINKIENYNKNNKIVTDTNIQINQNKINKNENYFLNNSINLKNDLDKNIEDNVNNFSIIQEYLQSAFNKEEKTYNKAYNNNEKDNINSFTIYNNKTSPNKNKEEIYKGKAYKNEKENVNNFSISTEKTSPTKIIKKISNSFKNNIIQKENLDNFKINKENSLNDIVKEKNLSKICKKNEKKNIINNNTSRCEENRSDNINKIIGKILEKDNIKGKENNQNNNKDNETNNHKINNKKVTKVIKKKIISPNESFDNNKNENSIINSQNNPLNNTKINNEKNSNFSSTKSNNKIKKNKDKKNLISKKNISKIPFQNKNKKISLNSKKKLLNIESNTSGNIVDALNNESNNPINDINDNTNDINSNINDININIKELDGMNNKENSNNNIVEKKGDLLLININKIPTKKTNDRYNKNKDKNLHYKNSNKKIGNKINIELKSKNVFKKNKKRSNSNLNNLDKDKLYDNNKYNDKIRTIPYLDYFKLNQIKNISGNNDRKNIILYNNIIKSFNKTKTLNNNNKLVYKKIKTNENTDTKKANIFNLRNYIFDLSNSVKKKYSFTSKSSIFNNILKLKNVNYNLRSKSVHLGSCFACDLGCSVSFSGYSPMTYSPYSKRRRKSITDMPSNILFEQYTRHKKNNI